MKPVIVAQIEHVVVRLVVLGIFKRLFVIVDVPVFVNVFYKLAAFANGSLFERIQVDVQNRRRALLFRCNAQRTRRFREFGRCNTDQVLNENLCHVQVRPDFERNVNRHRPVLARSRHIEHVFHAVDLLFQRNRDRIGNRLRVCPGIRRSNEHARRRHVRIQSQRQLGVRQRA